MNAIVIKTVTKA